MLLKAFLGDNIVPRELLDLREYFYTYKSIGFDYEDGENGIVAVSNNFRLGKIITQGKDREEVDENIKDAILTAFELPSAYKEEAQLKNESERAGEYALAK